MNDISFDIAAHWLPVSEKKGSIEKDTLRIKVAGINYHTKAIPEEWGVCTGYIKKQPDNPHDSNAIAFYKSDGLLLGYVQKELQNYVNEFTGEKELDCIFAISPFVSSEGTTCNQAYAYILKFFEDDINYATEMINTITENAGNDVIIDMEHFQKTLPSDIVDSEEDGIDETEEDNNTVFRYDEFYKFPQSDKTGKKSFDTLTVKLENADWFFDRKQWKAGVFSGYIDKAEFEEYNNKYGVYREDNSLIGWPNSFDFDDRITEFTEGHRVFCIFSLIPKIDSNTNCIEISGKAVLIKFFENEKDYAYKLFEETRIRLAETGTKEYKKFSEKKETIEDCGDTVSLSWSFDTKRYNFGEKKLTYLDEKGRPEKKGGCMAILAIISTISFLCITFLAVFFQ